MKHLKTLYRGRYLSLVERDDWEYAMRVNATGVVALVAVTDANELLLVEQFRIPLGCRVLELPAGLVGDAADPEESVLDAARRELLEETGYEAGQLQVLMTGPSAAGMSNEIITFVEARSLCRVAEGGGDASEDITVHVIPLHQVNDWITARAAGGTPADPKIFSALFWLGQKTQ